MAWWRKREGQPADEEAPENPSLPVIRLERVSKIFTGDGDEQTRALDEVTVDITQLGNSQERGSLQSLRFRINGQNVPTTQLYFDYATLGTPHQLDETARMAQVVAKARATSGFSAEASRGTGLEPPPVTEPPDRMTGSCADSSVALAANPLSGRAAKANQAEKMG